MRRFDLGACARKKNTGQQKSHKSVIFPLFWGEAPTGPIRPKSCVIRDVHDVITCAKFQIDIFVGYDFTGGRIFDFYLAMLCKRGLCCHAVSVRLSVRLSRSWITSKRINISSKFFHRRIATPFLFFRTKGGAAIPTGTPLTGASNARGMIK